MPRVWLGRTSAKSPVLCRVGCKTSCAASSHHLIIFVYHIFASVGDRQLQLTRSLERSPSSSFIEALESFVTWMVNAEQLLASEKFVVDELAVMEHQLSQCLVS